MNLLLRFFSLLLLGRFRSRVPALGPCRTPFRVMPTDLDVLLHVNNGVYLSMTDLARVDLMQRSGLAGVVKSRGWYPVVVAQTIQYKRSLKLFERFEIVTRVLAWNEKAILLEHRFERAGETVAYGLIRARFLSRAGGTVSINDLIAVAGSPPPPIDVPEYALRWNAEQEQWHGA
jgi:YbgC/YbaW family acyl-CoA thioester hydrolase